MATPTFCMLIGKEMSGIDRRCEQIAQTIEALEDERRVLEERNEALDAMKALYRESQKDVEAALATQARLNEDHLELPATTEH